MVEGKRTKWQSDVDKCEHRTGISQLWRLAKGLCGKQPHNSPNKSVQYADRTYLDPKMIANKFSHQFTLPPIRLTGINSKRQLKRKFHQLPLIGTPPFTPADTKRSDPIGCPCTTARKEAKGVRSEARHQSHFHTTLQKYRRKIAATQ